MKAFTFSFDDGYQSWLAAADVLETHGYRGTFNTCLRNVVHKRKTTRARMFAPSDVLTWDEVPDLQKRGHEIASHGTRHVDLGESNHEELLMEIAYSKRVFESRGIDVSTYACQFNAFTVEAHLVSRGRYRTIRGRVGMNALPFTGDVYHAQAAPDALACVDHGCWCVGIWHDVALSNFTRFVERVAEVELLTVGTVRQFTT